MKIQKILQALSILSASATTFFSLIPQPPQPLNFSGSDLIEHILAYLFISATSILGFSKGILRRQLVVGILVFNLGLLIEIIQPYTGRTFDFRDIAANTTGIILGFFLAYKFNSRLV